MKLRGFEFEDQPWFPEIIRDSMTDYLRFLFHTFKLYQPVLPLIKDALIKTDTHHIIDLCSGSGGAMEGIYENLKRTFNPNIKITLTDLFPSLLVYEHIRHETNGGISFIDNSIDACDVPLQLKGFRTLFSGFHHFEPKKAVRVLKSAVDARQGIGVFDGGDRSIVMVILLMIVHPILLCFCTPFFKPFRISRLLFTYLIPIIPFCTIWDGIFSISRLYTPDEMLQMAKEVANSDYTWISGKVTNRFGMSIAYLIGYPPISNNKYKTYGIQN
ncbi:MAG TPA: hypothetical protein DCL77_12155 [Prolixibacteraceae bacterium]|jgi:ubiquinone/menaquinone biosynthesis C-methylase UbiE|nr:hypothetical protein [Prolixibacteraceae bacterium]